MLSSRGAVHCGSGALNVGSTPPAGLGFIIPDSDPSWSLCAERIAVVKAVSEGDSSFECLYLYCDYTSGHVAPCADCMYVGGLG